MGGTHRTTLPILQRTTRLGDEGLVQCCTAVRNTGGNQAWAPDMGVCPQPLSPIPPPQLLYPRQGTGGLLQTFSVNHQRQDPGLGFNTHTWAQALTSGSSQATPPAGSAVSGAWPCPPPGLAHHSKALALVTWEWPSWTLQSFGNATSRGLGAATFWSPLLRWLHLHCPGRAAWGPGHPPVKCHLLARGGIGQG